MRGIGGPLLCIGDLLADLGEESVEAPDRRETVAPSPNFDFDITSESLDLTRLFQETYDKLSQAFAGSDHSWTGLTLELCSALETANKLVQTANANAGLLSEKVSELHKLVKKGDTAVTAARALHVSLNLKGGFPDPSQDTQPSVSHQVQN